MYDEIFLSEHEEKVSEPDNKIADIARHYLASGANAEEKSNFIKLRREYYKVKQIENYSEVQKKLYENKTKKQIISFELSRLINTGRLNLSQAVDISELLKVNSDDLTDELYEKMARVIIDIELSLGVKIGLFNELCSLFEYRIDEIEKKLSGDVVSSSKKK